MSLSFFRVYVRACVRDCMHKRQKKEGLRESDGSLERLVFAKRAGGDFKDRKKEMEEGRRRGRLACLKL